MASTVSPSDVKKVAALANLPLSDKEVTELTDAFKKTLDVVNELQKLDTKNVQPTSQVTGLENVMREDTVDTSRMFSQEEALANAPRKHNGYFVVDQVLEEE